jgi:hypothetical protein
MKNFNIMRPLLLLASAYFAYNFSLFVLSLLGVSETAAVNASFIIMMITAILVFMRMNKVRRK